MDSPKPSLENSVFAVLDAPYCVWDLAIRERNLAFLEGLDPEYFDYIAKMALDGLDDDENRNRAALLMRQGFHHGLETLFSLLGAFVQAPDCVYGWVLKCNPGDSRKLVERVNAGDGSLPRKLVLSEVSWNRIARSIFTYSHSEPAEVEKNGRNFGLLWRRLADEYIKEENAQEYNSIKHGLRVRPGGFSFATGIEHTYGVPPPDAEMQTLGHSDFGASFLILEKVPTDEPSNRSYRSRKKAVNWSMEQIALLLQLISISLGNIISGLKIANGVRGSKVKFLRPTEEDAFERPWSFSTGGITSITFDYHADPAHFNKTTKQDLLPIVQQNTEPARGEK